MGVVRCPQGHYYDDSRFSSCPHCGIPVSPGAQTDGETAAGSGKKHGFFGRRSQDKTVALGKSAVLSAGGGHTVALGAAASPADDGQRTVSMYSGASGTDYVTGWLVCVEGPEKGRDYRLHHGFNRIGRDYGMDVQVMDDPAVSRRNHCSVVYDRKSGCFSAVPGAGTLTYFKGSLLTGAEKLAAGDRLKLGESTFEFIPFCREGHVWEEKQE